MTRGRVAITPSYRAVLLLEAGVVLLRQLLLILLMDKILHDLKDSKLWELWYIPFNG